MKRNFIRITATSVSILAFLLLESCKDKDSSNSNNNNMNTALKKTITIENIATIKNFVQSGSFKGTTSPVIMPGESVSFKFNAGKKQFLMFTTMYGHSKDWFFASKQPGIKLFKDNGEAITGNVSSEVLLWDNGSKDNTTGAAESKPIMEVPNVVASQLMKLNLAYNDDTSEFTLTITNTSGGTANETPFSPGVWAVSTYNEDELVVPKPFFTPNALTNPEITDIAQMGDITKMMTKLKAETGIMTGLSPTIVVVYRGDKNPIYELGKTDIGQGLKDLSQLGDPSKLEASLKSLPEVEAIYTAGTPKAPVKSGSKIMTSYQAEPGDKIAYATMFGFSNDWFFANEQVIDANMKGDVSSKTGLFDSGTGVDQYPGAGNHQALFDGKPKPESKAIVKVGTAYPVPPTQSIIKVTVE